MERSTRIVEEGPQPGQRSGRGAAQDIQRGHRSLQILAGDRRGNQRAVVGSSQIAQGHQPPDGNHPGNQFRSRRAGFRSAGRRSRHGQDARTGTASASSSTELAASSEQMSKCRAICSTLSIALLWPKRDVLSPTQTPRNATCAAPPQERYRPARSPIMSRELHIVGFKVGRETYGVPITSLHEIVRVPEITAVPDAPDYLEGVINLRGKIVSALPPGGRRRGDLSRLVAHLADVGQGRRGRPWSATAPRQGHRDRLVRLCAGMSPHTRGHGNDDARDQTHGPAAARCSTRCPRSPSTSGSSRSCARRSGESFADYINETLGFGLTNTTLALLRRPWSSPWSPSSGCAATCRASTGSSVVLISVVGTLLTDNLTDGHGVPLWISTTVFAVAARGGLRRSGTPASARCRSTPSSPPRARPSTG